MGKFLTPLIKPLKEDRSEGQSVNAKHRKARELP
jgi:hypothetical protein